MKFTDLKNVKPQNITLQDANKDYADYLYALPENKPKRQIWAVVGTIAAAVVIILGVSLWAIIGRGIRGTGEPIATPALPDDESVEITEQMQKDFEAMFGRYSLHSFPTFERDTLPSKEALLAFLEYEQGTFLADSKLTAEEFNEFVFDWFGKTPGYEATKEYELGIIITTDYIPPKLLTFTRSYLDDGTKTVTLTYGDVGHWVVTLSYVAVNDFEPDYFIEKTVLNTIYLQKIDKDKMTASVYKVSGKLATQILDAKRYLKHSESKCKCIPDYRVCDSTLWYDFMLDGINPHTTRYDNPTCKLTADEQKKFKDLFEKCITEENFVETKPFEYTPSADKVTVTVSEDETEYKVGTHKITGTDAKNLITALETKSYTGDHIKGIGTALLKVEERSYSLFIDGSDYYLQTNCGGIEIDPDDDIIKIVKKYIAPEQTIIETEHSTYDESSGTQNPNKELEKNIYVSEGRFPDDLYAAEYLPFKEGFVTKEYNDYGNFYYRAKTDFVTKEPITQKMLEAANEYPYRELYEVYYPRVGYSDTSSYPFTITKPIDFTPICYIPSGYYGGFWLCEPEKYNSNIEYFESWLDNETFIVKGHFEEGYGTSVVKYSVDSSKNKGFNYTADPYTVHNFVIDKIYDENCEYKAGDIVEVGLGGTIMQNLDGFYCGMYTNNRMTSSQEYTNFKGKSLNERTFVIALKPSKDEQLNFLTVDQICQNAYDTETVYDFDSNAYSFTITAKEILEKYN